MALQIKGATIVGNESGYFDGGTFRMTTVKWPNWYVKMNDDFSRGDVQGKEGYPGDQGEFKFTRIGFSEFYLISPKRWPEWYIYMEKKNGNVSGQKGDPGPKGHWRITPRSDGTVLLSTQEWYDSYMYMQNWPSGDVQGTEEPDEQAYFFLSCDIRLKIGFAPGGHDDGFNMVHVPDGRDGNKCPTL